MYDCMHVCKYNWIHISGIKYEEDHKFRQHDTQDYEWKLYNEKLHFNVVLIYIWHLAFAKLHSEKNWIFSIYKGFYVRNNINECMGSELILLVSIWNSPINIDVNYCISV